MNLIAPSILDVKDDKLQETISELTQAKADWIHIDVIDWERTPSKRNYNIPVLQKAKQEDSFYDVHFMVDNNEEYIEKYQEIADSITIHSKSIELIKKINNFGKKVGIAINPNESFEDYQNIVKQENIDLVLFMSVFPGYGGQKFIKEVIENIDKARKFREENNLQFKIQVDGGINSETIKLLNGKVDIVVAGSYIIKSDNKEKAIQSLRE